MTSKQALNKAKKIIEAVLEEGELEIGYERLEEIVEDLEEIISMNE